MAPSSRFALSLKPRVAYLVLNFCALWKKQTTLPSLAYAGIPYQVLGARSGALALTISWSRTAMTRSAFGISAIFVSTSLSASALLALAFSSRARSLIAARSSAVNPFCELPPVWAGFRVLFFADFLSAIVISSTGSHGCDLMLGAFAELLRLGDGAVLFVADVVAPGGGDALLVDLDHGEVGHEPIGIGAVPMVFAGLEEHAITGPNDLDLPAAALTPADSLGHVDGLAIRMDVPGGPGAGREVDAARLQARRPGWRRD